MWTRTYSKEFKGVKKSDIWKIWIDINNWHTWHGDLDYCRMEGEFEVGNYFFLKPKGIKPVKIYITEINDGYSFTDCTSFFGAKMYDTHSLEETEDGIILSNNLIVTGPLSWFWIKVVAEGVANDVPEETEKLVQLARKE